MAKVLISFLGAVSDRRSYLPANYQFPPNDKFPDGKVIKSSFIAKALREYHTIDRLILIGSAHSMWEEVYREIGCNGEEDGFCLELFDKCIDSDHSSACLDDSDIQRIEEKLGNGSKVIIIKYGLNDDEIAYNTQAILGIEKYLNSGDKVYLDITHSFRSLPIYLMNCLIFLKNVSKKQIAIESISYGMLDVSKEYPTGKKDEKGRHCEFYTPVVELGKLMEVQDWITGAYNFQEFGNTYKIARLLEGDPLKQYDETAKLLRQFADIKNTNRLREFRKGIKSLLPLMDDQNLPTIAKLLVPEIIEKFTKRFPTSLNEYSFQYRMAEWHEKRHNYGYALINLVESALSYCCEIIPDYLIPQELVSDKCGSLKLDKNGNLHIVAKRNAIRRALNYVEEDQGTESIEQLRKELDKQMELNGIHLSEFNSHYDKINFDRNTIAHDLDRDKSYLEIMDDLKNALKYYRNIAR